MSERVGFWQSWAPHIVVANLLLVLTIFVLANGCQPAKGGEGSPWRAIGEQQRQIDSLHKRLSRLETLPTAQREERKRREAEERR